MSKPSSQFAFEVGKSLKELSTFGVGGSARLFTAVSKIEEMQSLMHYCSTQNLPFLVIGKGSNCLFDDEGFDGLVIHNKISFCQWEGGIVHVGAGYSFSLLGVQSARQGWSGLEFASGIPGSIGGAVFMNAGANGTETADSLLEVSYVDVHGKLEILPRDELVFSYRHSCFQKRKGAIVSAKFRLQPSTEARTKQLGIVEYRMETQPYSDKSAGCVFRNPPAHSAGALIQQCGLKGLKIGGAEVSTLHANFIVNKGGATSKDILTLSERVAKEVKEKTGVELEMEIRLISTKEGDVPR